MDKKIGCVNHDCDQCKAQQQEPVAHCRVRPLRGDQSFPTVEVDWVSRPVPGPLYTSPQPSKPWVGLTDEERRGIREWQRIQEELGPVWAPMMLYLYDAIEAKLKERNT